MRPPRPTRLLVGAAAGLLSAAAGVGASMVAAVVVGGAPTPITAVGSRFIDATPGALKDWAIRHLGTNDKPFLLGGIFTAIALVACLTGILAWRSRTAALALTTGLGLLGLAAAAADRTTLVGPLAKVTPALSALVVSVALLVWFTRGWSDSAEPATVAGDAAGAADHDASAPMHADDQLRPEKQAEHIDQPVLVAPSHTSRGSMPLRTPATVETVSSTHGAASASSLPDFLQSPMARPKGRGGRPPMNRFPGENPAPAGFNRRAFLSAALVSGAVVAVGVGTVKAFGDFGGRSRDSIRLPRPTDSAAALTRGQELDNVTGITPYLTSNKNFYRVDTALAVPQIDAGNWSLKIHGLVDDEIELSFEDLLDMPLVERRITLACVSNEVGGHYAGNATWLGVRTSDLFRELGISAEADAVKSTSVDGMTIGTPLQALTDDRDALIAIGMNGVPLPLDHGFPARMVVPGLYGYVSATKWLVDLEITRFSDFSAYWTDRGFDAEAPIKTFSRIDVPKSFAQLSAGTNAVAGVAWAQNVGIEKVEVRVDGGEWTTARLPDEDSIDTWRQWVYEWDAPSGSHLLEVRATDKSGYTQTSRRVSPRPNGATGWHSVNVTVT